MSNEHSSNGDDTRTFKKSRCSDGKRDAATSLITVVIVESHHHALEHIHGVLRRYPGLMTSGDNRSAPTTKNGKRKRDQDDHDDNNGNNGWSMLHFDSHADLACPGPHIPAVACFQPRRSLQTLQKRRSCTAKTTLKSATKRSAAAIQSSSNVASVATAAMVVEAAAAESSAVRSEKTNETSGCADSDSNDDDDDGKCLYELLDSTASGIAEWILPLVLAANLRHVHWIRPAPLPSLLPLLQESRWQPQIPSGRHEYNVGAWMEPRLENDVLVGKDNNGHHVKIDSFLDLPLCATVKVDYDCVYYQHDRSVVATHDLLLAQPLQLTVSEPNGSGDNDNDVASRSLPFFAVLDICLDYFACWNPFLSEIDALFSTGPALSRALQAAVTASRLYQNTSKVASPAATAAAASPAIATKTNATCHHTRHDPPHSLDRFHNLWIQLVQTATCAADSKGNDKEDDLAGLIEELLHYDEQNAKQGDRSLIDTAVVLLQKAIQDYPHQRDTLVRLLTEAIPQCSMPHMDFSEADAAAAATAGGSVDTTHISIRHTLVQSRVTQFQNVIREFYGGGDMTGTAATSCSTTQPNRLSSAVEQSVASPALDLTALAAAAQPAPAAPPPLIVTIARSMTDGFTPPTVVDDLQEIVLQQIRLQFCGCSSCRACCSTGSSIASGGKPQDVPAVAEDQQEAVVATTTSPVTSDCRLRIVYDYDSGSSGAEARGERQCLD